MLNEALRRIARVQKIDSAILELQKRFSSIDPGRSANAKLAEAQAKRDEAEAAFKAVRSEIEDLELKTKGIESKMDSEQKRLYSGGVYNAKDAEAIDKELSNLKTRRGQIDDRVLELWDQIEPAKARAEEAQNEYQKVEAQAKEYEAKYNEVKEEFSQKLQQLQEARARESQGCDPQLMKKYDTMRAKRGGVGIAVVEAGVCSACHTAVPKKQLGDLKEGAVLQTCENCLRYLYLPEEE